MDSRESTYTVLLATLNLLREQKPNDRSEYDRRMAVTITEMEKVVAYFYTYALIGEKAES